MLTSVKQGWERIAKKLKSIENNIKWVKCPLCQECWTEKTFAYHKVCPDCKKIAQDKKYAQVLKEERRNQQTFDNFEITKDNNEIYDKAKNFISNETGIYLYGKPGRGKSHLLNACYNKLKEQGKSVKLVSIPNLLIDIRKTYAKIDINDTTEKDILDSCVESEYLFLDELREKSEFCFQILFVIINQREMKHKNKIFITSNYKLEDVASRDDRISSRIVGMCTKNNVCELTGIDRRIK